MKHKLNKLKVLMIPDSFGWAYCFNARGVKKYSKHDITIRPFAKEGDWKGGLTPQTIKSHDVIFCFSRWIWNRLTKEVLREVLKKPIILYCCGKAFDNPPECVTAYAVCTDRLVKKAKAIGITNPVLLKEGIDTEIFKPMAKPDSAKLRVGWAGSPKQPNKRYHILNQLKYPVKIMAQRNRKFLVRNRSRQPMVDFYNGLDVYIIVSGAGKTEGHGVGLTVLEAMSCGLPVISTDYADVSAVIQPQWLVPVHPEELVIEQVNQKLSLLDKDRVLLRKVGDRNRQFILENRSWKNRVKDWDHLFEEVARKPNYAWGYLRKTEPRGKILFDTLKPFLNKGDTVLDVDCGYSPLAKHLLENGYSITGFDVSQIPILYLQRTHPDGEWVTMDDAEAQFTNYSILLLLGVTTPLQPVYSQTYLETTERLLNLNRPRIVLAESADQANQTLYKQVCNLLDDHHYSLKKKSHYDTKMKKASKRHYSVWLQ